MAQAEQLSEQGNWTEAVIAYRFALAEFPNNEAAVIGFGKACLFSGQIEFAQKAFRHALKVNPTNHQALSYIGDIQERMGQLDAAAESYLRAGNVLAARNDLDTAIDFWRRATALVSDHLEAHRKLAEGLAQQGQSQQAAREFLSVARIYQQRGDFDEAMVQIKNAEELLPDNPGILAAEEALQNGTPIQPDEVTEAPSPSGPALEFADEYFTEDTFAEGVGTFAEDPFALDELETEEGPKGGLLEATQQNALAELANVVFEEDNSANTLLIMRAIDLQSRKNLSEATNNYRRAIEVGMNQSALYFNLGLLYKELGQFDQAIEMLKISAGDSRYYLSSQFALAETYRAANKLELALKYFVETVKTVDLQTVDDDDKAQDLLDHYKNLAGAGLAQGDANRINTFITALKKFFSDPEWERKAFEARQRMDSVAENGTMSLAEFLETPETEVIITAMAVTTEYMKRNLLLTASEECLRAIQKAPSYLPLHVRLADILLKQEQTDQAITKYLYVTKVYQMRGLPEQAINTYQKVLRLAPMDVTVRSKLIDLYISRDNIDQALDQYLVLANSYYQLAQVDRALEKYNEALRLASDIPNGDPWKVEILSRMGDIYNQRFDWAGATRAYEELVEINDDHRVQQQLIDLYYKQSKTDQAIATLDNLLNIYQRQDPPKALRLLKELASSHPEDMALRQRLAVAYVQNGLNQEAIAEYDALGEMQLERGLRDQAVQTIQAILNLGPDDPEGYRRLLSQIG